MTRRRSLYARPAIIRGQQCAEARLGRRSDRAAACHGGGQAPPQEGDPPRSPCRCAVLVGCSPRRLCPAERPASRYRRRSRPCQDTSHGVSRRSASGGVHPSGSVVRDPAVRPVRCPARPLSSHLDSSSGIRRPASWCPPSGVQPAGVRPVRPDASVWYPSGDGAWGQADAARQAPPRQGPGSLWAAASPSGSGRRPSRPGRGQRLRLTLASRQARPACRARVAGGGTRQGRRPQREVAAAAARLPSSGWVGDHAEWRLWCLAARVDGPGGAGGDRLAAPARPRLAASVPGLLPAAL